MIPNMVFGLILRPAGWSKAALSRLACVALAASLALLAGTPPAAAIPPDGPPPPPPPPPCWENTRANFRADPSEIDQGQSTTLRWNVIGCAGVTLSMTP